MKKSKSKSKALKQLPIWGWILLALGIISIVVILLVTISNSVSSTPTEVTVAQAVKLQDQGAFILDVREPSEWTQAHIAGATLIPLGELPNRLNEIPKDKTGIAARRDGISY
jgi:hypothetical protein